MEAYKKVIWGSLIVVVLLILPLIIYFFFIQDPEPVPAPPPAQPAPLADSAEKPQSRPQPRQIEESLPDLELNSSDVEVRKRLAECSGEPGYGIWLKNSNIIRRVTAVTTNIANGTSPNKLLQFMAPAGSFRVTRKNGDIFIDPKSYNRYGEMAAVLESLDSKQLVDIYRKLRPLFNEAYRELGYPGESFDRVLKRAIKVVLNTPAVKGPIRLEEKVTSYAFADPELEQLNEAQKHLLRMGPLNARRIKKKLKEIAVLLDKPE